MFPVKIVRDDLSIFSQKTLLCVCLKEYVLDTTEILEILNISLVPISFLNHTRRLA